MAGRRGRIGAAGFWMTQRSRERNQLEILNGMVEITAPVMIPFAVSVNCAFYFFQ